MNTINIIGTLSADVRLRYPTDMAVGNFSIAYNKKFSKNGKIVEHTSFFDVVCFGKIAETINQYFKKGSRIAITGELEQQRWQTENGNRSKVVIRLEKFDFIDKKTTSSENQPNSYSYAEQQQPGAKQNPPADIDVDDEDIPF